MQLHVSIQNTVLHAFDLLTNAICVDMCLHVAVNAGFTALYKSQTHPS
jgi:hypothetical protein